MPAPRPSSASVWILLLLAGCGVESAPRPPAAAPPAITNRIPIPAEVVANLGITFERAQRGRLETRLRVPGRVEVAPQARFVVRAPASGRLAMRAAPWQRVRRGEVVAELLSAELRAAQSALSESLSAVDRADVDLERARAEAGPLAAVASATEEALAAAQVREASAATALDTAQEFERAAAERLAEARRLAGDSNLSTGALFGIRREHVEAQVATYEAAGRRNDARARVPDLALELATIRARVDTWARELAILERRRETARSSLRQQVRGLSVLTGIPVSELEAATAGTPAWADLDAIPLRSPADGLLVELMASDGEWVEGGAPLLRVVDPTQVVFRGEVPETDAPRIPADAEVRIDVGCADGTAVQTRLGAARPIADPRTRTILLEAPLPGDGSRYADGSSATMSILLEQSKEEEVLVPAATVVQDELETILFRRDPAKPDQVIRTPVSVGRRSGGWIEVLSEVAEGDEVVHHGVHQLRLTGIGKATEVGHFHADGSWHAGEED